MAKILFEYIELCVKLTKDKYWQDIIHNCACNKFPKGIKYNSAKKTLHVRSDLPGRKKAEVLVLPDEQTQCFKMLMYAFKTLLGLRSGDDISASRVELEKIRKTNEIDLGCEWKNLKPRAIRNHILINFAIHQVKICNLELKQAYMLYRQIQLGFQFKQLSADDIKYKNGVISSISGLKYNGTAFELTNKLGYVSCASTKVTKDPLKQRIDQWVKNHKKQTLTLKVAKK